MTDPGPAGLALPEYRRDWLERYDRLGASDAAIIGAEMSAFRTLVASITPQRDPRVVNYLDLGTCTGRYLRWGAEQGFATVCGVDSSPDSIAHCTGRLPGRVHLRQADFLRESLLHELAAAHGPFHLITAMLGTVDHLPRAAQLRFLSSLREILVPSGAVVVSTWRSGRCSLSLYSEPERRYLESTGFGELLDDGGALPPGLGLTRRLSTPWHTLTLFTHTAGPAHRSGGGVAVRTSAQGSE